MLTPVQPGEIAGCAGWMSSTKPAPMEPELDDQKTRRLVRCSEHNLRPVAAGRTDVSGLKLFSRRTVFHGFIMFRRLFCMMFHHDLAHFARLLAFDLRCILRGSGNAKMDWTHPFSFLRPQIFQSQRFGGVVLLPCFVR